MSKYDQLVELREIAEELLCDSVCTNCGCEFEDVANTDIVKVMLTKLDEMVGEESGE